MQNILEDVLIAALYTIDVTNYWHCIHRLYSVHSMTDVCNFISCIAEVHISVPDMAINHLNATLLKRICSYAISVCYQLQFLFKLFWYVGMLKLLNSYYCSGKITYTPFAL